MSTFWEAGVCETTALLYLHLAVVRVLHLRHVLQEQVLFLCVAGHLSAPSRMSWETWWRDVSWRSSHDVKLSRLTSRVARSTLSPTTTHRSPAMPPGSKKHIFQYLVHSRQALCCALPPHGGQLANLLAAEPG